MQNNILASVTAIAISATLGGSTLAGTQTAPPIGGGYTNVIPIPVDNPTTKNISGALFKPDGAGPFPAVVYMSGCAGTQHPSRSKFGKGHDQPRLRKRRCHLDRRSVHAAQRKRHGTAWPLRENRGPASQREGLGRVCDPGRQRRRCGGKAPSIYARHRPQSNLLAGLLDWRCIVAVSGRLENSGGARRQDRWGHRVLPLLPSHRVFSASPHPVIRTTGPRRRYARR